MKCNLQVYCGEIAEKSIRGTLGSLFQLQVTAGILLVYILGAHVSAQTTSIVCGIIPIFFAVCIFFCPESPTFHVSESKKVLKAFELKKLLHLRSLKF